MPTSVEAQDLHWQQSNEILHWSPS